MVSENRAFILNLVCLTLGDPLAANCQPPLLISSPTTQTQTHRETFIISSFPLSSSSLLHMDTSTIYLSRHRLDTFTRIHTQTLVSWLAPKRTKNNVRALNTIIRYIIDAMADKQTSTCSLSTVQHDKCTQSNINKHIS